MVWFCFYFDRGFYEEVHRCKVDIGEADDSSGV